MYATAECPNCRASSSEQIERFGRHTLFHCGDCGLQFWNPREMPDAAWYERVYGKRDQTAMPLEPGHRYFLSECRPYDHTELLDIGCGTGNFLAAAQRKGFHVTGTELDRNAAAFARETMGIQRILPYSVSDFAKQPNRSLYDIVTFFEVLEHQADPIEFIENVRACLKPGGAIALSVPNRDRWKTAPDVLDYPPNHFLRWNSRSLARFLTDHGFTVESIREEPASYGYTAQMINSALRSGMTEAVAGEKQETFRDIIQSHARREQTPAKPSLRMKLLDQMRRAKLSLCYALAIPTFPYVRARGSKGAYLYCRARM